MVRIFRQRRVLGTLALLLAAVFLASQAFACCYAYARLGRSLASLFAPAPAAHSCCAKAAPSAVPEKPGCAQGCCLQDASQRPPQLASTPFDMPGLAGPMLAIPACACAFPAPSIEAPAAPADNGPPLYLRTLRLRV